MSFPFLYLYSPWEKDFFFFFIFSPGMCVISCVWWRALDYVTRQTFSFQVGRVILHVRACMYDDQGIFKFFFF